MLTILCMLGLNVLAELGLHAYRVAVTPFLLLLSQGSRSGKESHSRVRKEQSEIVAVVQQGLQSIQVVKAFGQEKAEEGFCTV